MYPFHTFLLIILICLIGVYLIYRWIQKRKFAKVEEGLEMISYPNRNAFLKTNNLPLKEYVINASFNSAYDGDKVTIEQLGKVIYMGCRFIDVNVFITDSKDLYVGFATDNAPTLIDVSLPFNSVISYINSFGFTVDPDVRKKVDDSNYQKIVQNTLDKSSATGETLQKNYKNFPLFLNIRVYRPPTSKIDIISEITKELNGLKRAYIDDNGNAIKITQYTPLSDIMGKVVVSMDIQNILQIYASPPPYDPNNVPLETRNNIESYINVKTGGDNWGTFYKYEDVEQNTNTPLRILDANISDNTYETNALNMKLSYPYYLTDKSNPDSYSYILNHQIQTIPHRYYIQDSNLAKYTDLFETNKTPFLPLYYAYTYINKKSTPLV